jgi:hypothetical protein
MLPDYSFKLFESHFELFPYFLEKSFNMSIHLEGGGGGAG